MHSEYIRPGRLQVRNLLSTYMRAASDPLYQSPCLKYVVHVASLCVIYFLVSHVLSLLKGRSLEEHAKGESSDVMEVEMV